MKVCLVKQNTTYDLYTKTEGGLKSIVESSNWRLGPAALWEAFDVDFRIVNENNAKECKIGNKHWGRYVTNWDIWPDGKEAEEAESIEWSQYDIVISIDIAIPSKIVRKFRKVMWCYYFIEGGTSGIDTVHKGSPFYGYNAFFNHRLPRKKLLNNNLQVNSMITKRRSVLDFPYYLLSSQSIRSIYAESSECIRDGIMLSHHSYKVISELEQKALSQIGTLYSNTTMKQDTKYNNQTELLSVPWQWQQAGLSSISDLHKLEFKSKYLVVHPACRIMAGLALIEAISAGCLALAPKDLVVGFPELINERLNYSSFEELLSILSELENNPSFYLEEKQLQCLKVDKYCFETPVANLITLYNAFQNSKASAFRQHISEWNSYFGAIVNRLQSSLFRKLHKLFGYFFKE